MKNFQKYHLSIILVVTLILFFCLVNVGAASVDLYNNPTIKTAAKRINDFIPKGWKINYKIEGDLNKDKLIDFAAVIEQNFKYEVGSEAAPERILIIAFRQKDNNSYKLSIQSSKAILLANDGGVFGDPFYEGLSIKNGTLVLDFYGGSIDRWGLTYKFRYQNSGWFMIGATVLSMNVGDGHETIEDYNLSTGKAIVSKGIEGNKLTEKAVNRGVKKLLNLKDFNPWIEAGKDF